MEQQGLRRQHLARRRAVGQEARRAHREGRLGPQLARIEIALDAFGEDDRRIEAAAEARERRARRVEAQHDVGIARLERPDPGQQPRRRERGRHADRQAVRPRMLEIGQHLRQRVEHRRRVLDQPLAVRRQLELVVQPLEQRRADVGLERLNAPADRGHREVELARGRRQRPVLGDDDEGLQRSHGRKPSHRYRPAAGRRGWTFNIADFIVAATDLSPDLLQCSKKSASWQAYSAAAAFARPWKMAAS